MQTFPRRAALFLMLGGLAACAKPRERRAKAEGPAEINALIAIHRKRLAIDPADNKARVETNRQFHGIIVDAARNERLRDAILRSGRFYFNGSVAQRTSDEEFHLSNRDHDRIVLALEARDGDAAELAMRNHILRTFHIFQRLSYPSHEAASLAPLHGATRS